MKRIYPRLRSGVDRLGIRLAVVLAVALLPLMIVSIVRSQSVVDEALARSQDALVGETLRAVRQEVIIIERAKAVAQSISRSVTFLLDNPELCNRLMRDKLIGTEFSFAGFYDTTGYVPCSSADAPFSIGMTPELVEQIEDPRAIVLVNEAAEVSGTSVIYASYPVFGDDSKLRGFTAVSVPHRRLGATDSGESGVSFLTLNAKGTVLTYPDTMEAALLLLPELAFGEDLTKQETSFRAVGRDGVERLYALVSVVDRELFALSTWPLDNEINGIFYMKNPAIFPVLMWLASLGVAWFATSVFVTRHVVHLRRSIRKFAATRQTVPADAFLSAPGELRDVANTFIGMTDTIIRDEAQIEDTLRQKDILLREVHHRVKNNLQLIASIMSMQMRQSRSKEVKHLMQSLHDRVNSLATIHRSLYQTTGQADVSMDEHLDTIVKQVIRMGSVRKTSIDLKTDFSELRLNPDQAVPLSLFVTEAMTNALKYIGSANGEAPELSVTLALLENDEAEVTIINSTTSKSIEPNAETSTGLGAELMEAFAGQLDGTMSAEQLVGHFKVHLTFPIEPLTASP